MKTPIEEFYEYITANIYFVDADIKKKYKELLIKERDVVIEAYEEGQRREAKEPFWRHGGVYFNHKFNYIWEKLL